MIFRRNKANHSLLLMPVKLGSEKLPRNKVRILSCDTDGNLFTQLLGRSVYRRIRQEAGQADVSPVQYATVYWDKGEDKYTPLYVEIGEKELWALDRIMEHALKSSIIPDVLKRYPKEIIKLGELKYKELLLREETETGRNAVTSRVLQRLPYYRKEDIEVSVPIYKSAYAFPLIILKVMARKKDTPAGQRPALVLDSDGDIVVTDFSSAKITGAKRKLAALEKNGTPGYLVCVQTPEGISIEAMETTGLQKQALENVTRRFEEKGDKKQPVSAAVQKVMKKAREKVRAD